MLDLLLPPIAPLPQASDLRTQIADARTTGESLAVQESLLSSPSNIRTQADEN